MKIGLGEPMEGPDGAKRQFPKEVRFFWLDVKNGVPQAAIDAYGPEPTALRMMLPFEMEAVDPHTGDQLVVNEYMRAYRGNGLLACKGTGGSTEYKGTAETTREDWAHRLEEVTGDEAVLLPNGRWRVTCWGLACPKYLEMVDGEA